MTLYSYRSTGYITKFDSDGNVEASYQVSPDGCTCPAGHRPTCRHRQMLPDLRPLADTHWFWDFDRKEAVDLFGTPKATLDAFETLANAEQTVDEDTEAYGTAPHITTGGLNMLKAENEDSQQRNAITDAVGGSEQTVRIAPSTKHWRRL